MYFGSKISLFSDVYHECPWELEIILKSKKLYENTQETYKKKQ